MRGDIPIRRSIGPLAVGLCSLLALGSSVPQRAGNSIDIRPIQWDDLPAATHQRLERAGIGAASFPAFLQDHQHRIQARVREGDLDALVYYALQSTVFTNLPPIEPALSARDFVRGLDAPSRRQFLSGGTVGIDRVPGAARRRLAALLSVLRTPPARSRLGYFRLIVLHEAPAESERLDFLLRQYVRSMRFLYEKEFVAQQAGASAVEALYHDRGLSTDTAVEAGYLVHLGLATLQAAEPSRRIRRVLIIGPGLDLAPRTGLIEAGPPESYQPYALIDSLVSLGLARLDDLVVVGADVNPRVVRHLETAGSGDVSLTLVSGVGNSDTVTLEKDYREYFARIGAAIGLPLPTPELPARYSGHLRKALLVRPAVTGLLRGVQLDVATQRIAGEKFDLVVATNVLPYLDDTLLTIAVANVAEMLDPGGVLLHNEGRQLLGDIAGAVDLPLKHARTGAIATVRGAAPLSDGVWIHEKSRGRE